MKKKIITTLLLLVTFTGTTCAAYNLGKANAIPENYIELEKCVPLDDIACWYIGEYDYICLELGDVGNQLDKPENISYKNLLAEIPRDMERDMSEEVSDTYALYGRYFLDGTFIDENGEVWHYEVTEVSGQPVYDNMPVYAIMWSNGTVSIADDEIRIIGIDYYAQLMES